MFRAQTLILLEALTLHLHTQVISHGLFAFDRGGSFSNPVLFPGSGSSNLLVAPFWANHDTRMMGEISYEVHNTSTGVMSQVSEFITEQLSTFQGTWMLVADWSNVPQQGSSVRVSVGTIHVLCTCLY